ncbi:MAG: DUF456 domain-containing protein [Paludibacteraceae bacterium]|nr:DUF456 domain-containing protein [Paludibacteraceae bacterium]
MLTILWWALVALCLCLGFMGCFINKVPGPIAVVIATLLAILCLDIPIEWSTFGIITALAIASMIVSKLLVKLVKKLQEYSKRATWGTTIGSIIGLLLVYGATSSDSKALLITMLIVGFVVLPFVLAFLLELTNKQGALMALKCATSATCAYLSDTLLKLAVFVYAIYVIFQIG